MVEIIYYIRIVDNLLNIISPAYAYLLIGMGKEWIVYIIENRVKIKTKQ